MVENSEVTERGARADSEHEQANQHSGDDREQGQYEGQDHELQKGILRDQDQDLHCEDRQQDINEREGRHVLHHAITEVGHHRDNAEEGGHGGFQARTPTSRACSSEQPWWHQQPPPNMLLRNL